LAGTKKDDYTLRSEARVVDAVDVSTGTFKDDRTGFTELGLLEADGEQVRERHPGYLRVVTTITADAVALVASAMLAGWIGDLLSNAPVVNRLFAAFDTDPQKVGTQVHGVPVRAMDSLESGIKEIKAEIAILTVPSPFAQSTAETLVRAGITSIWNFTNTKLKVPDEIIVQREDLSSGYALLSVQMLSRKGRS